ncbi:MAG: proline dehydrogenase family protein [bacterium]|nr:proline dehydrogenase family protein [bacterium]
MKILDWLGVDPMGWFLGDKDVASRLIQMTMIVSQTNDPDDIKKAFFGLLEPVKDKLPRIFSLLFLSGKMSSALLAYELHIGFRIFAGRFIGGNDMPSIVRTIRSYHAKGIKVNLDILGDAVFSEKEAQKYIDDYCLLFSELPKYGINASHDVSASIKISAAYSQIDPSNPDYSVGVICNRLEPFFVLAQKFGFNIYFDALEREYREIQFRVFERMHKKYGDTARFVVQSYFKDSLGMIDRLAEMRVRHGSPVWVRLVLGAYHSFEQYTARIRGQDIPVWTVKEDTNRNFRACFSEGVRRSLCMVSGTQNADHILYALKNGSSGTQLLRGMGEPYAFGALVPQGFPVCFYVPVVLTKSFAQGIGFLIRRVDDNTGPESFLARYFGRKMKGAVRTLKEGIEEIEWRKAA